MTNDENKFSGNDQLFSGEKILACIDGSSTSESVCDYAAWVAKATNRPLKLMHSIEHNSNPVVSDYSGAIGLGSQQTLLNELTELEQSRSSLLIKQGQLMLNAAKERVKSQQVDQVETYQHHGSLSQSLVELENEMRAMVIGIRGEMHEADNQAKNDGIGHQLESVIRSMHKPVLVVNKAFSKPKTSMLAYDGSESCKKALQMIVSSKLFKGMPCHIVHVGENNSKTEKLLADASQVLNKAGIKTVNKLLSGSAVIALTDYQLEQDIDLTLMGAFSHNKFRDFLLGSFTEKMLTATNRPLLLLR